MKTRLVSGLILLLIATYSVAQLRTSEQARRLAAAFLNRPQAAGQQRIPVGEDMLQLIPLTPDSSQAEYYVFNLINTRGFIVVSGDERAREILAWSDQQSFASDSLPDNLKYWLSVYSDEIKMVRTNDLQKSSGSATQVQTQPVAPLLGRVKWDQGYPYNLQCPVIDSVKNSRAVVGCVATGMAQVMYYHRWPEKGTGSKTYTTETLKIPLSADFSTTTYAWDKMTATYNSASTAEAQQAVATLMYHCGVAVEMDYNTSSAAYFTKMGQALITHFGYDANLQLIHRNYYSREAWVQVLLNELYAARPILYGGTSASGGGHLWVCDGVDANGYFHFNWGWSGLSDGYYAITALNPSSLGIGGGSGGYNYYQQIITGMQRPNSSSVQQWSFNLNELLEASIPGLKRQQTFTITAKKMFNNGLTPVSFQLGLGLYNGNTLVNVLKSVQINTLQPNYGWNSYPFSTLSVPVATAAGNYQVRLIRRFTSTQSWSWVPVRTGIPAWLDAKVTADSVLFSVPPSQSPVLSLEEVKPIGSVYTGKTGRFSVTIRNSGKEYNSSVLVRLTPVNGGNGFESGTELLNLISGESATQQLSGTVNVPVGEYWLTVLTDVANNYQAPVMQQLGDTVRIRVKPVSTTAPSLTLTEKIAFSSSSVVSRSQAVLRATINNTGGVFENYLNAFVFTTTAGSSVGYIGYKKAIVDSLETATFSFSGDLQQPTGDYRIGLFYYDNGWKQLLPYDRSLIFFTLVDDSVTSVPANERIKAFVAPNPVVDELVVFSEEPLQYVRIFSSDGRMVYQGTMIGEMPARIQVSHLTSGIYSLLSEGIRPVQLRFIKQ